MSGAVSVPGKNPTKVRAGACGAAIRWGPPRRVRLDDFDADERAAILAAIEAKRAAKAAKVRNEKAATGLETVAASGEGTHDADSAA